MTKVLKQILKVSKYMERGIQNIPFYCVRCIKLSSAIIVLNYIRFGCGSGSIYKQSPRNANSSAH